LLQQVAERLREDVREVDTVSRLGGDEFLIIVPELRQVDDARHISRKLLQSLSEPYVISGQRLEVTPSIGVSVFPDDGTEPSTLIRLADQAMYTAKQEGRRTIRFFRDAGSVA
jgi:diguanylate cyclase (GGDEF)-like protein